MKKLVVIGDDFGLCESVNIGVVESHKKGIVTEVSLMLGSPGTDHAMKLVRENNIENVGIHLLLKNWRDTGKLVRREDYVKLFNELSRAEVAGLVTAELKEFEAVVGHKPTHITSQFGIAAHAKAIPGVIAYAKQYNIPMRQPAMMLDGDEPVYSEDSLKLMRTNHVRTTGRFFAHIMEPDYGMLTKLYQNDLSIMADGETAEIALHPGLAGEDLQRMSSLVDERARDMRLATDKDFQAWLEQHDIKVVGYGQI